MINERVIFMTDFQKTEIDEFYWDYIGKDSDDDGLAWMGKLIGRIKWEPH
jgi:hypothetical protein